MNPDGSLALLTSDPDCRIYGLAPGSHNLSLIAGTNPLETADPNGGLPTQRCDYNPDPLQPLGYSPLIGDNYERAVPNAFYGALKTAPDGSLLVASYDAIRRYHADGPSAGTNDTVLGRFSTIPAPHDYISHAFSEGALAEGAYDPAQGGSPRQALGVMPDGRVLFSHAHGEPGAVSDQRQLWRVEADGRLQRVAGSSTNQAGNSGDGGPARAALLGRISDIAAAPDGTIYVGDADAHVTRAIAPDGTISTVAEIGGQALAIDNQGRLLIAVGQSGVHAEHTGGSIWRLSNGALSQIAGHPDDAARARAQPAMQASGSKAGCYGVPTDSLAVGPDGSIYAGSFREFQEAGAVYEISPGNYSTDCPKNGNVLQPSDPVGDTQDDPTPDQPTDPSTPGDPSDPTTPGDNETPGNPNGGGTPGNGDPVVPEIGQQMCLRRAVNLTNVSEAGGRVAIEGWANPERFAGKKVSIKFALTGEVVARAKVAKSGAFSTSSELPADRYRTGNAANSARYQARIGKAKSLNLKLDRRSDIRSLTVDAQGTITLRGRIARPGARVVPVVISSRNGCKSWKTVIKTRVRLDSNGRFSVRIKGRSSASVYRFGASVVQGRRQVIFPTYSLPTPVAQSKASEVASKPVKGSASRVVPVVAQNTVKGSERQIGTAQQNNLTPIAEAYTGREVTLKATPYGPATYKVTDPRGKALALRVTPAKFAPNEASFRADVSGVYSVQVTDGAGLISRWSIEIQAQAKPGGDRDTYTAGHKLELMKFGKNSSKLLLGRTAKSDRANFQHLHNAASEIRISSCARKSALDRKRVAAVKRYLSTFGIPFKVSSAPSRCQGRTGDHVQVDFVFGDVLDIAEFERQ